MGDPFSRGKLLPSLKFDCYFRESLLSELYGIFIIYKLSEVRQQIMVILQCTFSLKVVARPDN